MSNQQTTLTAATELLPHANTDVAYEARGFAYEFVWYDESTDVDGNRVGFSFCVYAYRADGTQVWSGCAHVWEGERVIDCIRMARENSRMGI